LKARDETGRMTSAPERVHDHLRDACAGARDVRGARCGSAKQTLSSHIHKSKKRVDN